MSFFLLLRARAGLILAVIAHVLVALVCFLAATATMDGLYDYSSPLNDDPVAGGDPVGDELTSGRVVLVLVDGLRVDTATDRAVMPTLGKLRDQGAERVLHCRAPSYSAPGWTVLSTGAWPDLNGGEAMNPPEGTAPLLWKQDNIFAAAQDSGLRTGVTGNDWWRHMLPPERWSETYFTLDEDTAADEMVVEAAVDWLVNDKVDLLMVDLNGLDDAGHNLGGPDGPHWDVAARSADDQIGAIANVLDLSEDTLLVISDHGHIDAGGHGGTEAEVLQVPFVMVGGPTKQGSYSDAEQVDVASTVTLLLGTRLPAVSQGLPMTDMLHGEPAGLATALHAQQQRLAVAHSLALHQSADLEISAEDPVASAQAHMSATTSSALLPGRILRGAIAGAALLGAGLVLWRRRSRLLARYTAGAAAFLAAFHLWFGVVLGKTYSLSWVESTDALIGTIAAASAVGLVAGLPVALTKSRPWRLPPGQAATRVLGATSMTLLIAGLPAVVNWVVNGIASPYALPQMHLTWFGFSALLQGLVVAAAGLLMAAIVAGSSALIRHRANIELTSA